MCQNAGAWQAVFRLVTQKVNLSLFEIANVRNDVAPCWVPLLWVSEIVRSETEGTS
jgi:hypothetical protein